MSTETELKLILPPQALRRAQRLAWLRKLAPATNRPRRITSVYFDTTDLRLREHDVKLRVRRDGAKWLQTIKLGQNNSTATLGHPSGKQKSSQDCRT